MGGLTDGPGAAMLSRADRDAALAAVKAHLRAATGEDDALVVALAEAALGLAEQFTGQVLIAREMVAALPAVTGWQLLPAMPVRAITGVAAGTPAVALSPDACGMDIDAGGAGWVRTNGAVAPVGVRFAAGIAANWSGLPAPLRQGVVMLAAHLFTDRDQRVPVPAAVAALWRPFRIMRLARERRA